MKSFMYCPNCEAFFPHSQFYQLVKEYIYYYFDDQGEIVESECEDSEIVYFCHDECDERFETEIVIELNGDVAKILSYDLKEIPLKALLDFIDRYKVKWLRVHVHGGKYCDSVFDDHFLFAPGRLYIKFADCEIGNAKQDLEHMKKLGTFEITTVDIPVDEIKKFAKVKP